MNHIREPQMLHTAECGRHTHGENKREEGIVGAVEGVLRESQGLISVSGRDVALTISPNSQALWVHWYSVLMGHC